MSYRASDIAATLGGKPSGSGWMAQCPVHNDGNASLSIRQGEKAVLVTCHAGCTRESILEAFKKLVGANVTQAPPQQQPRSKGSSSAKEVVATYNYCNSQGSMIYQKLRFEPKDFRLRKPKGTGWEWNLSGVNEVVYRLPEVNKAKAAGELIFVVEGEKDADNLSRLGLCATTNTHGASKEEGRTKWRSELSRMLEGAAGVIILPDNDKPGQAHANSAAQSLRQLDIPVKIVNLPGLPEKGDVSDFLAGGGTKEKILALAKSAPFYGVKETQQGSLSTLTVDELMARQFQAPRWAIEDLLPEGLTILAGAPKLGKSWMALQIALGVSRGEKVLGDFLADSGEVLYLALEDSLRRLQQRVSMIADDSKLVGNRNLILCTELEGMENGGIAALEEFLENHPDCRLVIIDTLAKFLPPPESKSNAYQGDYKNFGKLQKLALKYRIALMGVHHMRKMKASDVLDEVSGSAGVTGAADAIWILKRARTESSGSMMITGRDIDEMELAAEFDKDSATWTLTGDARAEQRRKTLITLTKHFGNQVFTYASICDVLGISITHSKRVLGGLLSAGYVTRLEEKVGRAFQFKLTDRMTDVILGSDDEE